MDWIILPIMVGIGYSYISYFKGEGGSFIKITIFTAIFFGLLVLFKG